MTEEQAKDLSRLLEEERYRADYVSWQLESTKSRRWNRLGELLLAASRNPMRLRELSKALRRRPAPPPPPKLPPLPDPTPLRIPLLDKIPPNRIPEGPIHRPELKVAAILDTFSAMALRYEWRQIDRFGPDEWRDVLSRERPDLLFVESAWRGNDSRWRLHIRTEPKQPLRDMVAWCRDAGIPTVFWNKEDPPNYEVFLEAAKLFDWVFTVDSESVPRYREDLEHDRIAVLPFAAQPRIHNPIRAIAERPFNVAFAGTYFAVRHPERQVQMETVVSPAREFDLHIYSRREPGDPHYDYPETYRPHIVGTLPYDRMLAAQKLYRVVLNVNTVEDSPTMCARRAFEVAATGTPILTGYSRAIQETFGNLLWMSHTPEETRATLASLLDNPEMRDRTAHLALREVMTHHTYRHRISDLLNTLGLADEIARPSVSVVLEADDADEVVDMLPALAGQSLPAQRLIVLTTDPEMDASRIKDAFATDLDVEIVTVQEAMARARLAVGAKAPTDFIAYLKPGDLYGPHHLADLVHAFSYTDAGVVGRRAHHAHTPRSRATVLIAPDEEHRYVDSVPFYTMVARTEIISAFAGDDTAKAAEANGAAEAIFTWCAREQIPVYSADRYSYVEIHHDDTGALPKGRLVFYGPPRDHVLF